MHGLHKSCKGLEVTGLRLLEQKQDCVLTSQLTLLGLMALLRITADIMCQHQLGRCQICKFATGASTML